MRFLWVSTLVACASSVGACATPQREVDEVELSLILAMFEEACGGGYPTLVQQSLDGSRLTRSAAQYAVKESQSISEEMARDLLRRNRHPVDLRKLAPAMPHCTLASLQEIEDAGIEEQTLPTTDDEQLGRMVSFSRPGFNANRSEAVVYRYTAGSGMCIGAFNRYTREAGEWRLEDQVQHLIC